MALKFLAVTLFFALVVQKPVHDAFPDKNKPRHSNSTRNDTSLSYTPITLNQNQDMMKSHEDPMSDAYLWMYPVFAYLFTGLAVYLLVTETERIISIRQTYLGNQSTITDRTIRLSGIPEDLRSEEKIKAFIEKLEIGKVESVLVCRNWEELDSTIKVRTTLLRKLEESWTVYLGQRRSNRERMSEGESQETREDEQREAQEERYRDIEDPPLIEDAETGETNAPPRGKNRPVATVRYGFLKLRSRAVDAIDYYEAKLKTTDEKIHELRKKTFEAMPLAFVTMDSVAACQMAVQAVLDPSPMHLIAKVSPAPTDVIWTNSYIPRSRRMLRGWTISLVITILTIFWSFLLVPIAGALNVDTISEVFPQFGDVLKHHKFAASLVTTQLPTLLSTLLFVSVPYLYDWLANMQGMMSQSDIELSVISKNFFFVFFNYFVIFTILGTASNFSVFWTKVGDSIKDTTWIANQLAQSLQSLLPFYTNLIILQGVGLFPFRLLEIGSVSLYPLYRYGSKTPRDFAELVEAPIFNYGFYLPQVMLIFIICIVYSVLRESWQVILAGLLYFMIGGFVYKYQLLYAMDHRQHSTGKAWLMICDRMIVGLVLFQLTTAGQLALKKSLGLAALLAPLVLGTIIFGYKTSRVYTPLMNFIALQSIERQAATLPADHTDYDPDGWSETARLRYEAETHPGTTVDESDESGLRFINPSLIAP